MKLECIKKYNDRYTHNLVQVGDPIDAPEDRAKELINAGVAEKEKPAKKTVPKAESEG